MASQSSKRRFLTSLGRALPTIIIAIAGTYVLSRRGTLHGLERMALDAEMAASPHSSSSICLVEITDTDYDSVFNGESPLRAGKLHDLINAIALSRPAVIGVDIDTSHPQFRDFKIEGDWPPIIWERDISTNGQIVEGGRGAADVLGGKTLTQIRILAFPILLVDPEDKATRLYTRCLRTKAGLEPTFVYALSTAYRSAVSNANLSPRNICEGKKDATTQALFINYALRRGSTLYEKDAAQVLGLVDKEKNSGQSQIVPDFLNKIVLVGGTYRDFDRHFTPVGELPGVVVLANAVETELEGGAVEASPRWVLFGLEFFASALLVLLFHQYTMKPGIALACGIPLTIVISLIFSFISFHTFSRFVNFAPTLVAVLIFEVYEYVRHESILRVIRSKGGYKPDDHESIS